MNDHEGMERSTYAQVSSGIEQTDEFGDQLEMLIIFNGISIRCCLFIYI